MNKEQLEALARLLGADRQAESRLDEAVRRIRQYADACRELNPADDEQS